MHVLAQPDTRLAAATASTIPATRAGRVALCFMAQIPEAPLFCEQLEIASALDRRAVHIIAVGGAGSSGRPAFLSGTNTSRYARKAITPTPIAYDGLLK